MHCMTNDVRVPLRSGVREETIMAELDPRAAGARRLRDKVCVVTGAGHGIGRATARCLGVEMGQEIRNQQAIKRAGRPEEQAATIAFLASNDAPFITGQVINCSGGRS